MARKVPLKTQYRLAIAFWAFIGLCVLTGIIIGTIIEPGFGLGVLLFFGVIGFILGAVWACDVIGKYRRYHRSD